MHNIFALPVLSYVAQVQGDRGIEDFDLDRAVAILFKNPMYRPPHGFFTNLPQLGVNLGMKDIRLECKAAAARTALSLNTLAQARRIMAQGSDDDHLVHHPLRSWQTRSATITLGTIHDQLRAARPDGLQPPFLQRQCRHYLKEQLPKFDYLTLIQARLTTVLRRNGIEDPHVLHAMAKFSLQVITMASEHLHCSLLSAFLRFAQNGLTICTTGDASHACPLCGAQAAARLSHLVRCGALWLFLDENCPGLGWDCSAPDRWQYLFGASVQDSASAALLCLAWDCIQAGLNAGRFGREGTEGCLSRLIALVNRPGLPGQLARALTTPPPLDVQ
jgi:hypothetical protein